MQRKHLIAAVWAAVAALLAIACAGGHVTAVTQGEAATRQQVAFSTAPKDRALLESPAQVGLARRSGGAAFRIGSEHFVAANPPREYVGYSSWRTRVP